MRSGVPVITISGKSPSDPAGSRLRERHSMFVAASEALAEERARAGRFAAPAFALTVVSIPPSRS
jgi:hypothetical protein